MRTHSKVKATCEFLEILSLEFFTSISLLSTGRFSQAISVRVSRKYQAVRLELVVKLIGESQMKLSNSPKGLFPKRDFIKHSSIFK